MIDRFRALASEAAENGVNAVDENGLQIEEGLGEGEMAVGDLIEGSIKALDL